MNDQGSYQIRYPYLYGSAGQMNDQGSYQIRVPYLLRIRWPNPRPGILSNPRSVSSTNPLAKMNDQGSYQIRYPYLYGSASRTHDQGSYQIRYPYLLRIRWPNERPGILSNPLSVSSTNPLAK
ncbi:hypothetical protein Bbelb_119500 [Branchiostoma belcheri]|nr:hypothetical protein Bbelb_119500 [Branchiostoma belcheri]